jgi:hypothetical protein
MESVHGGLAMMVQLDHSSTAAGAMSSGALALRFASVAVVQVGASSPSVDSAREALPRRNRRRQLARRQRLG